MEVGGGDFRSALLLLVLLDDGRCNTATVRWTMVVDKDGWMRERGREGGIDR